MGSLAESSLFRAASSTFEELGFMLPDREPSARQLEATLDGEVSVAFRGPFDGYVRLRVYGGVLPALAMNMLGEPEPPVGELQRDALGEVANVICGNALPAIAGSAEIFRLDAPCHGAAAGGASGAEKVAATLVLGIDDGRAELTLFASTALAAAPERA